MPWATEAEVLTYTGIDVTSAELNQAQFMVELFADVTEDNSNISSKNLRLLKMAVAYQAAFITDHPDMFTHVDVSTMLQDGIQFVLPHANAGLLAPMAKRAIDRLSWRRNRSIKIRRSKRSTAGGQRSIEYGGFSHIDRGDSFAHYSTDPDSSVWGAE